MEFTYKEMILMQDSLEFFINALESVNKIYLAEMINKKNLREMKNFRKKVEELMLSYRDREAQFEQSVSAKN